MTELYERTRTPGHAGFMVSKVERRARKAPGLIYAGLVAPALPAGRDNVTRFPHRGCARARYLIYEMRATAGAGKLVRRLRARR